MAASVLAVLIAVIVLLLSGSGRAAAASTPCTPTPNPSGTGYWTPFGLASWTSDGLQTSSQSAPSQPYAVTCGGASVYGPALPTTNPAQIHALSFDFNANMSGPSGTSPRLIMCFSDGAQECSSNGSLAPTTWTANTWTHVDGFSPPTGLNAAWSNNGGVCGATFNTTWAAIVACHPGASITLVALVNDSGHQYPGGEQVLLNNMTVNNVVAHASAPVFTKTASVAPSNGVVLYKLPGSLSYKQLKTIKLLPYGTTILAPSGILQVIAARGRTGTSTESGDFYDGSFKLSQGNDGFVTAALTQRATGCRSESKASAHISRSFSLWGHVRGHYRTRGHYGSASVGGTIWLTEELCDGTYFHVVQGVLKIRDFTRHRTVIIRSGHSYLAPSSLPKKRRTKDSDGDFDGD